MNKWFTSIKKRCEKISDIVLEQDLGKQMVSIDDIRGIIDNEAEDYKNRLWHYLYKNDLPINFYGLQEIWVIVKFKKQRWLKPIDIVKFRFDCQHFYTADGTNVTNNVTAWTDVPEDFIENDGGN